jgi:hypothetical protein
VIENVNASLWSVECLACLHAVVRLAGNDMNSAISLILTESAEAAVCAGRAKESKRRHGNRQLSQIRKLVTKRGRWGM